MRVDIEGREFWSLDEATRRSGYDYAYLRRLASTGKVDARRIGASWVLAATFIDEYRSVKPQRKPRAEAGRRREGKASGG